MRVTAYKCIHSLSTAREPKARVQKSKIVPVNFTAKPRVSRDRTVSNQSMLGRTISDRKTEFVKSLACMTRMSRRVRTRSRNKTVYRLCRRTIFYWSTVAPNTKEYFYFQNGKITGSYFYTFFVTLIVLFRQEIKNTRKGVKLLDHTPGTRIGRGTVFRRPPSRRVSRGEGRRRKEIVGYGLSLSPVQFCGPRVDRCCGCEQ